MERWREVDWLEGYKGVLEVSDAGNVRRSAYAYEAMNRWRTLMNTRKPDKILSPYIEKNGYPTVAVQINGRRKKFAIHRLVARAFVGGYGATLTVNHINGIKTDNRADNLEWVTRARNTAHAWEAGLVNLRAESNPNAKLTSGQVRIMRRLLAMGATAGELATLARVSPSLVDKIAKGFRWSSVA